MEIHLFWNTACHEARRRLYSKSVPDAEIEVIDSTLGSSSADLEALRWL